MEKLFNSISLSIVRASSGTYRRVQHWSHACLTSEPSQQDETSPFYSPSLEVFYHCHHHRRTCS